MAQIILNKKRWGWWKNAVFYQVYPRSFQDTDSDGIGDLRGVIRRLDYLQELGVDGIWLSPVFASPQADNGYDISDYQAVDPMFGTMKDLEKLIREAGARGMILILDLVLNHSSDEHRWFREARKSRDNPYHDYYIWRSGSADRPPNDMCSVFGGSAWTYVPELGQYYFHQFSERQPDLNWDNEAVRAELYSCIRFWVEKGVGGFRLDVIDQIAKDPDRYITANGPQIHEFLRELHREAFPDCGIVTVGEAWSANVERARLFSAPDGSELSMVFQFEHLCLDQEPGKDKWHPVPLDLRALKQCICRWQQGLYRRGWNSLFLCNHDLPRIVSRWGDDGVYREKSAKMLAIMLHGLQGTPYIYQGEELGMTNIRMELEEYPDLETRNMVRERLARGDDPQTIREAVWARGRDNARTPMQWSNAENAGFTDGTPWLRVNPNYRQINAADQLQDPDSVFHCYRRLIELRKTYPVFRDGTFELLCPEDPDLFAYVRRTEEARLLVVCSFSKTAREFRLPAEFADAVPLISNESCDTQLLGPYGARMLYLGREQKGATSNGT